MFAFSVVNVGASSFDSMLMVTFGVLGSVVAAVNCTLALLMSAPFGTPIFAKRTPTMKLVERRSELLPSRIEPSVVRCSASSVRAATVTSRSRVPALQEHWHVYALRRGGSGCKPSTRSQPVTAAMANGEARRATSTQSRPDVMIYSFVTRRRSGGAATLRARK